MLAAEFEDFAAKQPADHIDRFEQNLAAHRRFRPVTADDMLVQRLTGAEPEHESPRKHRFQRRGCLRQDRRVIAIAGRRDARPEPEIGGCSQRAEPCPDKC